MFACDFEYDGKFLSDFGFIICQFNESGGSDVTETGYNISFNTVSRNRGRISSLIGTTYESCVQSTFQICKDPDKYDNPEISQDEYRTLVRWLNRHEFLPFRAVYGQARSNEMICYFNGSFNIGKIYVADKLYGLELSLETDAPYGYGPTFEKTWTIGAGESITFSDTSDESRSIRPDMTIICNDDGTLSINNETTLSTMQIANCTSGEIITVKGEEQIISSSNSLHKIYNDFNYEFLRIGNSHNYNINVLTFSLPCTFTIKYNPIIKDIP